MNDRLLKSEGACRFVVGALCAVYFAGYFARLNYAAVIAEIVVSEGIAKSDAALATTACFITYGVGQLCSGWLGDRVSPKWLIGGGLAATACINLLLPGVGGVGGMTALWAANGLAQSLLWPPMMRLMAGYFSPRWVERGCVDTSIASSAATVALYLTAPLLLRWRGWRTVFYLAGGLAAATALAWAVGMTAFEKRHGRIPVGRSAATAAHARALGAGAPGLRRLVWEGGLLFVMVGIIAQGTLRDGVTTWLPSYLTEVFHLPTASSILSSVAIPLLSILSFKVCAAANRRFVNDEVRFSRLLFVLGAALSLGLAALFTASAVASALLAATLTACMHGVNLMLICNLPARFAATGRVATISGLLNACTYIGSALSTYGFALVAQSAGWRATVLCWAAICLVGAAALTLGLPRCGALIKSLQAAPQEAQETPQEA